MTMKRIIGGKALNTETAQPIARTAYTMSKTDDKDGPEKLSVTETLYRTRGGQFFMHRVNTPTDRRYVRMDEWGLLNYDEAHAYARQGDVELLAEGIFPTIPEAKEATA